MSSDNNLPPDGQNPAQSSSGTPAPDNNAAKNPLVPFTGPDGHLYLPDGTRLLQYSIEDEMKGSYLTYAMSVIISRAIPDVRDGLKPSQRRILVAMNDLNLSPSSGRIKCAKISGDTSGNYHPHGEAIVYPTLVRMAQEWNMRHVLVDKQGNFGSIAGLPPAAMRYTEARLSGLAMALLEDLNLDTVDFVPTYDERNMEPTVLPSKVPNLLVNGADGIAVGMATNVPPHNLGEVCDATIAVIDNPNISPFDLLKICPGPDFPTGGIICGRRGLVEGYLRGRGNITIRARAHIETEGKHNRIVVSEIPYKQKRDVVETRIADMVKEGKILGISAIRNESDLKEPVRLILELRKDADPDIVLNQLYQYTPLQDTFSIIFLALVDGKPRILSFKEMVEEFIRHRVTVIRRRTIFLMNKALKRQHTVEGLLIAHANIDEVIQIIRTSSTQAEAKERLRGIQSPAALLERALGAEGYAAFVENRGGIVEETYSLSPVQADAILKMTLGQLVNLEQEKLGNEYQTLLADIGEFRRILSDEKNIRAIVRSDLEEVKKKFADKRRTEISEEEISDIDYEDLINEETMVVSITENGYIKRTASSEYKAQRRGGKGLKGAKADEENPIQHLFVASTHDYLLFFTNKGKVYWQKVYNIPQMARDAKGRALVNLLNLAPDEKIADCKAVQNFDLPDHYLVMATKNGLVKKTVLTAFKRPLKAGLIAIKLKEEDELIDVNICGPGDEIVLSTAHGMAIRFRQSDIRAMGRNTSGVKGIRLRKGDSVVGMVIADEGATLLTVCANGFGKRTPFGPNAPIEDEPQDDGSENDTVETEPIENEVEESEDIAADSNDDKDDVNSSRSYRVQRRGGGGIRDIKASKRNGPVIGILRVEEDDEMMMITAMGKIQRVAIADISVVGRNTQGVRIMKVDDGDTLVAINRIEKEEEQEVESESSIDAPKVEPEIEPETDVESDEETEE